MSAASLPTDRLIGEVLAQRYEIQHRLGEGAMGAVYKARHVKVGRSFAVKVLHARTLEDPKVAKRFDREAELAGRLRHPNVVGVVDVGDIDGMRYMVMDFAEGPDLAELLVEAPMPPARIIHLVRQMLEGLYHAHEQGLIHRDFKPENVIVERDAHGAEVPRIVDFGIAILRDGGAGVDQQGRLTTNGLVLGTPHYMAPEQAVADPIDHRIDLFALGIVIYEMLSGRLPYDGSGAEVARANLLLDPPPIVQRVPYLEVDPLLEAFARRLMAKKRNARPATAKAARELLDLIERDRAAAGTALGLTPQMSQRGPALTVPVHPSPGDPAATPPGPWSDAPTVSMHSPGGSPPVAFAPPVMNAPASVDPRAPVSPRDVETSRRVPLSWQVASSPRRRAPWVAGGAVVIVVGMAGVLTLAGTSEPEPAPERVVMTPVGPEAPATPSTTGPASLPSSTDTSAAAATSGAVAPTPVAAPSSEPGGAADRTPETPGASPGASNDQAAVSAPITPGGERRAPRASDPSPAERARRTADPRAEPRTPGAARAVETRADDRGASQRKATSPDARATEPGPSIKAPARASAAIASEPETADGRTGDVGANDARTADAKRAEPRRTDAKRTDARPADAKAADAKPADAKPADAKSADARAIARVPRTGGLTANELSNLYSAVGRELSALPSASIQDLWSRLLRIKIQELMGAPQARRDEVTTQLLQIHQDAMLRKP